MTAETREPARSMRPEPIDAADRARLRDELDSTFFVEAGAGTGKTTALVSRIVAMVAKGRVELDRLAAITFTEAAAAELRSRIRRELERAATGRDFDEVERARCLTATGQVDLATIQTIHAFAATILRTFPIEAGLPPGFQVLDQVQTDLEFDEKFRAWLWDDIPFDAPENSPRRNSIRRALLLGLTFDQLRALAEAFEEHGDLLDPETNWPAALPPDPIAIARRLANQILGIKEYFSYANLGESDPMIVEYRRHELAVDRLLSARTEADSLTALINLGKIKGAGNQINWRKVPSGQSAVKIVKDIVGAVNLTVSETLAGHRLAALGAALGYVRDFTLKCAAERRSKGVATFHDLLTWARDLLKSKPDVRQRARQRFARIFVDEFQDTDPLQAEIVWFLASDDATSAVGDWADIALEPGKLFVVGDPKQAIYRFRRADIGLYLQIYGSAPPETKAQLRENFRSVPAVLDWVNFQFGRDMVEEPGVQAPYVDLHAPYFESNRDAVQVFGELVENAGLARELEATAVAQFALNAVAEGRLVRVEGDVWPPVWRPARYRDICVLLRSRTNARDLEDSFERFGVPYRMESGSLVLDTQEVRDLLACLRSIDDPSDQVALVTALRSPAYACSDVDLLTWIEAGGKLDYVTAADDLTHPIAQAFKSLHGYHEARADRSVAATIEAFVRERNLAVGAFDGRSPREAWRRLRYVVAQARKLAAAGRPTLRALVDWLESLQRERIRDVESPVPDSDEDAVRVLTIHGAKGQEFPIVVLTGLGSPTGGGRDGVTVIPSRHDRSSKTNDPLEIKFGKFETAGFADTRAREKEMAEAELVRLFYVAATRAQDQLVLSLFHGKRGRQSTAARILDALTNSAAPTCAGLSLDGVTVPETAAQPETLTDAPLPADHQAKEVSWQDGRTAAIAAAKVTPVVFASRLAHFTSPSEIGTNGRTVHEAQVADLGRLDPDNDDDDREGAGLDPEAPPATCGRGLAVLIGRAVHDVLAEIGPNGVESIDGAVARASSERRIADRRTDVRRLVAAALASPTVVAAKSLRNWREVPLGVELEGVILLGRIDLLIENSDGTLRIVDFKTDSATVDNLQEHARRYRPQAGAYALAIHQSTGKRVEAVTLVFAAAGGREATWIDVDKLIAEAGDLIQRRDRPMSSLVDSPPSLQ